MSELVECLLCGHNGPAEEMWLCECCPGGHWQCKGKCNFDKINRQDIRREVIEFAMQMEQTLRENDEEKGDSWKRMEVSRLELLLTREISELCDASFKQNGSDERRNELRKELIDVANLAMMVWQRKKPVVK